MSRVLERKLKLKDPNPSVSLRMHREDLSVIDEIEAATGLKWDSLLRMMVHTLRKHWEREKKIILPAVVMIMSEDEARRLGLNIEAPKQAQPRPGARHSTG